MTADDTCQLPPDDSVAHATPDSAEAGAWLPLRAALAHLGIAERTLYRRIDRGELRTQKNGPRLEIWCAGAEPALADARLATRPQDERSVALAVVEQYGALIQRIEALAAENGQLRAELEMARKLAAEAPVSLPPSDPVPTARRPWWRRIFGLD